MSYDVNKFTKLGHLKKLAEKTKDLTDAIKNAADASIKSGTYANNRLSFFTTDDHSGTAAFYFDLPEEMFLDQNKTKFVSPFTWSAETYPGSTAPSPSLDGKPVMVLAVKGDAENPSYSFLDMEALVDTYSPNDDSVTVGSYKIGVKIDPTAGNALTLVSGKGLRVDISGKADKPDTAATDNLAAFDANRNPVDSGIAKGNVQQKLTSGSFTEGNVRVTDANGFAKDGGVALTALLQGEAAIDTEVDEMLDDVFSDEDSGT